VSSKLKSIRIVGFLTIIVAAYILLRHFGVLNIPVPSQSENNRNTQIEEITLNYEKKQEGKQIVNSVLESYRYPNITVKVGTPVEWIIDADGGNINGCNNRMLIREYGIQHAFKTGKNVIEFIPSKIGKFQYGCWMGMIRGTITVEDS
jgi:plastocyanin domain-containing protein